MFRLLIRVVVVGLLPLVVVQAQEISGPSAPGGIGMATSASNATLPTAARNLGIGLGSGLATGSIVLGNAGTGYVQGDSITLACVGMTATTAPVVAVNQIGGGGAVTGLTVTNPGFITVVPNGGSCTFTQASTSGVGTGATVTGSFAPIAAYVSAPALGTGGGATNGNFFIGGETPAATYGGAETTGLGDRACAGFVGAANYNTCSGHNAGGIFGLVAPTGQGNLFDGNDAGRDVSGTASFNTGVGRNSLRVIAGNGSVGIGANTGSTVTGGPNLLLGTNVASTTLTTGVRNILLGTASNCDTAAAGTNDSFQVCDSSGAGNLISGSLVSGSHTLSLPNLDFNVSNANLWTITAVSSLAKMEFTNTTNSRSGTFGVIDDFNSGINALGGDVLFLRASVEKLRATSAGVTATGALTVTGAVNKWTFTAPTTAATLTAGGDNLTYTMPAASKTIMASDYSNASGPAPVACGSTCTLGAANRYTYTRLDTAGGSVATLPGATGTGNVYKLYVSVATTSAADKVLTNPTTDTIIGTAIGENAGTAKVFVGNAGTFHSIQMPFAGSQPSGGFIGDEIVCTDVASTIWMCNIHYQAGTTPTTPYSASTS